MKEILIARMRELAREISGIEWKRKVYGFTGEGYVTVVELNSRKKEFRELEKKLKEYYQFQ